MAEVIDHWPEVRKTAPAAFEYPWDQWGTLDENGHGDIWLAERGIDFPAGTQAQRFQAVLYNRAHRVTAKRKKSAPLVLKRVTVRNKRTGEISEKVKKVPSFKPFKVKVRIVSDDKIAFQFYDSPEPPPAPETLRVAVPRRKPIHKAVTRRTIENTNTRELVSA